MPSISKILCLCSILSGCAANAPAPSPSPAEDATAGAEADPVATDPAPASSAVADDGSMLTALTTRFVARLETELELTDDQAARVRAIFDDYVAQMKPHVAYIRSQPDRQAKIQAVRARRPEIRKIRETTEVAIEPVLTPAQHGRYVELREELRQELRKRFEQG